MHGAYYGMLCYFTFPGTLGCDVIEVTVNPSVADKKSEFSVNGSAEATPISLNLGATRAVVSVKSPDGSNENVL